MLEYVLPHTIAHNRNLKNSWRTPNPLIELGLLPCVMWRE